MRCWLWKSSNTWVALGSAEHCSPHCRRAGRQAFPAWARVRVGVRWSETSFIAQSRFVLAVTINRVEGGGSRRRQKSNSHSTHTHTHTHTYWCSLNHPQQSHANEQLSCQVRSLYARAPSVLRRFPTLLAGTDAAATFSVCCRRQRRRQLRLPNNKMSTLQQQQQQQRKQGKWLKSTAAAVAAAAQ